MQNIKNRIRDYLEIWWTILVRPIYFYAKMKDDSWQGKSLSFFLVASWILAFAATIIVFVVQYIPVGSTLVEGISGFKFITILPVLLTLMFVFFSITLLISGGFFVFTFFILFYFVALMLHYIYMFLGGKGNLRHMVQSVLYSSAVLLFAILLLSLIILISLFSMRGHDIVSSTIVILLSTVLVIILLTIRDLQNIKYGGKAPMLESVQEVLEAMGKLRYYNVWTASVPKDLKKYRLGMHKPGEKSKIKIIERK